MLHKFSKMHHLRELRRMHPHYRHLEGNRSHYSHPHSNYTITTEVVIRVTPRDDFFLSWGILWSLFVLASIAGIWQALRERTKMASHRRHQSPSSDDGEQASAGETVSTAEVTRSLFRRLLILAMIARVILMPVQIEADPLWWQFVGDTLPKMIFASAWSLLVTFFVQLVGIAAGTGTNVSPGIVIQATAYVVYFLLIGIQLFNYVASVLLYALLCCIYAALFGTVCYFCPRLLSLLGPTFTPTDGLAVRLILCTVVCILVFAADTVAFARIVVAPPRRVYWWWNYGALELFPACIFLVIMHPTGSKTTETDSPQPPGDDDAGKKKALRRSESIGSGSGSGRLPTEETSALLKGSATYGAIDSPNV